MADQASDFMRQAQAMARQSWEQWMRHLQQAPSQPAPSGFGGLGAGFSPGTPGFGTGAGTGAPMSDVLERSLSGIKGYLDWMQRAAGSQSDPMGVDWQAQMQQLFGNSSPAFSQAFSGIDSTAAQGFAQQWQAWLAAAGQGGLGRASGGNDWRTPPHMPAFGLHREQQEKQQALMAAMFESAEQQRRYQALLLRANAEGLERLQDKLAEHSEPGRQIESLKALYDLWIDSAEEAYAEIALSDEFRHVYGAMVNAQMLERQLMQQQLEELCRQLGLPTRSEMDSLGKRLQELRREQRAAKAAAGGDAGGDMQALRAELAALKKQLAASSSVRAAAESDSQPPRRTSAKAPTASRKRAAGKLASAPRKSATVTTRTSTAKKAPATAAAGAHPKAAKAKVKVAKAKSSKPKSSKSKAAKRATGKATAVLPGIPAPRRGKRK